MFRMVVFLMDWPHYGARRTRRSDIYDFRWRVFDYRIQERAQFPVALLRGNIAIFKSDPIQSLPTEIDPLYGIRSNYFTSCDTMEIEDITFQ